MGQLFKTLNNIYYDMEKKDLSELVTQVDYYMSDANLEYDEFFYSAIENSTEKYLDIDLVMNCNKIKKGGWSIADVQAAVEKSDALELSEDQTQMRRKDKKLPKLKRKTVTKTNSLSLLYLLFQIFLPYQRMVSSLRRPLANNMVSQFHTPELTK